METMSVKDYAELVGKNRKTVYNMIKEERVPAYREDGEFRIYVDTYMLKALNEARLLLINLQNGSL